MTPSELPVFLSGGGEVGALMRRHDWTSSALGHPTTWPQSLRSLVGLMMNSMFPIFVAWGPDLCFLYNDAYCAVLGDKHPSALGNRFEDIWREVWTDIRPSIEQTLEGQASFHTNQAFTINRKGFDEIAWFTFSYSPVRDESGEVAGIYCTVVETTAQVLSERTRMEQNARLQQLFAQAPSLMAVLRDPDHVFELANEAYLELVGGRDVLGKTVREILPDLEGQGFYELLDQVYASGEAHRGYASPVELLRGGNEPEVRFIDFLFQPIKDGAGEVTGIFVEGYDVTSVVTANEELRTANRRKDEFLAMLAHELRNPLSPIRSAADLLRVAGPDTELVRQISAILGRQVAHMTGLIDDLVDVSRVTRGLISLHRESMDIRAAVRDAVEQVRPLIRSRHQHLTVDLPDASVVVHGDHTRLVQVFANLLNNAAKYTPERGNIVAEVVCDADTVEISVHDDGGGISRDLLPHLFDLFTQAERTPDRGQGGLGLGLALVRSLVELHDGRVSVDSGGEGQGSRFAVCLPLARDNGTGQADGQSHDGDDAASPDALCLLVVDDNTDAAEGLRLVLESLGHQVHVEHDGHRALVCARKVSPAVLFLDIGLPNMDGYELAHRLRGMPETADATLVAVTGYGQPEDRDRAHEAGFDHHVVKPVKLETILELLRKR